MTAFLCGVGVCFSSLPLQKKKGNKQTNKQRGVKGEGEREWEV